VGPVLLALGATLAGGTHSVARDGHRSKDPRPEAIFDAPSSSATRASRRSLLCIRCFHPGDSLAFWAQRRTESGRSGTCEHCTYARDAP
jgi:hypothetical protein